MRNGKIKRSKASRRRRGAPDNQLACIDGAPTRPRPLLFLVLWRVTFPWCLFLERSQTAFSQPSWEVVLRGRGTKKEIKAWSLEGQPKSTTLNASAACFK